MKARKLKNVLAAAALALTLLIPLSASAAESEAVTEVTAESVQPVGEATEAAEENIFSLAYETVLAHSGELLSGLAFIGTLVIGLAYKKGLLPAVTKTLSALGSAVSSIKEQTERSGESTECGLERLTERFGKLEGALAGFASTLESTEQKLDGLSATVTDRERMNIIMSSQIDLLYDVFMSSSLPAYQKEAVGERVHAMKQLLEAAEENAE